MPGLVPGKGPHQHDDTDALFAGGSIRWHIEARPLAPDTGAGLHVFYLNALTDDQLRQLMQAAAALDPAKRLVLAERLAGQLRLVRHPSDADVKNALTRALHGLQQG